MTLTPEGAKTAGDQEVMAGAAEILTDTKGAASRGDSMERGGVEGHNTEGCQGAQRWRGRRNTKSSRTFQNKVWPGPLGQRAP